MIADIPGKISSRMVFINLFFNFNNPFSLAIDEANKKIYFTITRSGEKIQRCDFDGSNVETLDVSVDSPKDIVFISSDKTSVEKVNNEIFTKIYPNPFFKAIAINTKEIIDDVSLINSMGKVVYISRNINDYFYNISINKNISDGIYILKLKFKNNKIINNKLVHFIHK